MTNLYDIKITEVPTRLVGGQFIRIVITDLGNKPPDEFFDTTKLTHIAVEGATLSIALAAASEEIEKHFTRKKDE